MLEFDKSDLLETVTKSARTSGFTLFAIEKDLSDGVSLAIEKDLSDGVSEMGLSDGVSEMGTPL